MADDRLLLVAFEPQEAEQGAGFAQQLGIPFDVLGFKGQIAQDLGAGRILLANQDVPPADGAARAIQAAGSGYSHIAAVSSMRSKDILARTAGLLGGAMVTDAVEILGLDRFHRPIVAGAAIATVEALTRPIVVTFRPSGFKKPERSGASAVETVDLPMGSKTRRISREQGSNGRPDLSQAKVIVSGGRPLKDAETFERIIGGLADTLGGAVGATRAAVDSGIASNELQVGQTGKIVAPDLYIAAGISGSTQHVAGIKDSKLIVAVNKDPDAPIFDVADLGIVGDLFDVLPELKAKLSK